MVLNNRCLQHPALVALLLALMSPPLLADFEAGLRAYKRNNFSRAQTELLRSAMLGHAGAQFYLGEIHEGGVSVDVDYVSAFKWYRSAAQKEHPRAQRRLAYLYSLGLGTDKDEAKAFEWFLRSANNGDVLGQLEVGLRYWQGQGTSKNPLEAYKWLTISASYGDPDALAERNRLDVDLSATDKQKALVLAREWEQRWESNNKPEAP
jgi:hypothetical protein